MILRFDPLYNHLRTDFLVPDAENWNMDQAVTLTGEDEVEFGPYNTVGLFTSGQVEYISLLGNSYNAGTFEIVSDPAASSGKALHISGQQKIVFRVQYPYDEYFLKKVVVRAKKVSGTLYAGVAGYKGDDLFNKDGLSSLDDYYKVTLAGEAVSDTVYDTFKGHIKLFGTAVEPAPSPDAPSPLREDTTDIAMVLECDGEYYIDAVELKEVENSIIDIPDGQGVIDGIIEHETELNASITAGVQLNKDTFGEDKLNGWGFIHGIAVNGAHQDGDGNPLDGAVEYDGALVTFPPVAVQGITASRSYLMYDKDDTGTIKACTYDYALLQYKDNTSTVFEPAGGIIIGHFDMDTTELTDGVMYQQALSVAGAKRQQATDAMSYLAGAGDDPTVFGQRATNLGIENVFTTMAIYQAFINYLRAANIISGPGDESALSGFRFRVLTHGTDGRELLTPIFDIWYNDKEIFKIDASSGDIFFGEIANGGLKWDMSTNTLRSRDDKLIINTDGTITSESGSFEGTISARTLKLSTLGLFTREHSFTVFALKYLGLGTQHVLQLNNIDDETEGTFVAGRIIGRDYISSLYYRSPGDYPAAGKIGDSTIPFQIAHIDEIYAKYTYDSVTTPSSANVHIASDGQLKRSTSSRKYKKNIEPLREKYISILDELRPVWYREKVQKDREGTKKNTGTWSHWGLIAEEVAEIDPRLVDYAEKDGVLIPEGVQYTKIIPLLIKAYQKEKSRADMLEKRIKKIEEAISQRKE